jgi:hypothetical protein
MREITKYAVLQKEADGLVIKITGSFFPASLFYVIRLLYTEHKMKNMSLKEAVTNVPCGAKE